MKLTTSNLDVFLNFNLNSAQGTIRITIFNFGNFVCRYINSDDYEGGFDEPEIDAMLATISLDFLSWAKGFVPLIVGAAADNPSAAETLARTFFAMDPRVADALARMIFLGDNRGVLGRVAAPSPSCTPPATRRAAVRRALHGGAHRARRLGDRRLGRPLPAARGARRDAPDTRRCARRGGGGGRQGRRRRHRHGGEGQPRRRRRGGGEGRHRCGHVDS